MHVSFLHDSNKRIRQCRLICTHLQATHIIEAALEEAKAELQTYLRKRKARRTVKASAVVVHKQVYYEGIVQGTME